MTSNSSPGASRTIWKVLLVVAVLIGGAAIVLRALDPTQAGMYFTLDLLAAALAIFTASGFAGARVDEIARAGVCSAGLVYTYVSSKEALFDAIMGNITVQAMGTTLIDPSDLPGYAVRAYESAANNPDVGRFAAWYQLESLPDGASREALVTATKSKIALLQEAQDAGRLSTRLPAAELLIAVQVIAHMWLTLPEDVGATADPTRSITTRAESVRRAVEALVH